MGKEIQVKDGVIVFVGITKEEIEPHIDELNKRLAEKQTSWRKIPIICDENNA